MNIDGCWVELKIISPDQQLQIIKIEISSFKIEVKCKSYRRSKCEFVVVVVVVVLT